MSTKLVTGVLRKTSEDKVGPASIAQIKVVLQNCQQSEPPRQQKGLGPAGSIPRDAEQENL